MNVLSVSTGCALIKKADGSFLTSSMILEGFRRSYEASTLKAKPREGLSTTSQNYRCLCRSESFMFSSTTTNTRCVSSYAMSMDAGHSSSNDSGKISLDETVGNIRKLWNSCPQPVKDFPWIKALENYVQLLLDLFLTVVKYLYVPLLAISSLSEMSYCAHERKMKIIPLPFLMGFSVAWIMKDTAVELSPTLKDGSIPWHLLAVAIFFTLLKLLGPYYPYWGRILIPHFANGALWSTLWSAFVWYQRPKDPIRTFTATAVDKDESRSKNS